jgi:sugar phosphate isomerase/epimerase
MAKAAKAAKAANKRTVGVQLIIFGKRPGQDLAGVLDEVAAAGYQAVETGVMTQVNGKDFKKMLADRKLAHVGAHTGGEKADQIGPVLDWLGETGGTDLIFSDLETRTLTEEMYQRKADAYNAAGEKCRQAGITLSYHNHAWEFGQVGGKIALEWLYEHTDPQFVKACIDAYWVWDGKADPAAFLRKHGSRLRILHAKDSFNKEVGHRAFCPVGAGVLDFPGIFKAIEASPAPWVVVEEDLPRDGTTAAQECALSRKYIKEKIGI